MMKINEIPTLTPDAFYAFPDDEGKTVLSAIDSAKDFIDIVIYEIGCPILNQHLIDAILRGVKIRCMINSNFSFNPGQHFAMVKKFIDDFADCMKAAKQGRIDFYWSSDNFVITHQKTIFIDHRNDDFTFAFKEGQTKVIIMSHNLISYKYMAGYYKGNKNFDSIKACFWGDGYPDINGGTRDFGAVLSSKENEAHIASIYEVFQKDISGQETDNLIKTLPLVWSNGCLIDGKFPKNGGYPLLESPIYHSDHQIQDVGSSLQTFFDLINAAEKEIILSTEVLTCEDVVYLLKEVAENKDIKVKLLINNVSQYFHYEAYIQSAGGEVYVQHVSESELTPDNIYIHAKYMVIDRVLAFVSSQNLSFNSLVGNRELGFLTKDQKVIDLIVSTFEKDIARPTCREIFLFKKDQSWHLSEKNGLINYEDLCKKVPHHN